MSMKRYGLIAALAGLGVVAAQQPAPKQPAPAAAPAKKAAPAANSGVDNIIELVKGGLSESMVISAVRREGKAYKLTTADLVKLQKAGVSENIIQVMMDPSGAPASAPAPAPAAAAAAPAAATITPVAATVSTPAASLPTVEKTVKKRRIAVMAFDYAAVQTWVQYWFHSNVNIGEGIRAMLVARMHQAKNVTLLERARLDAIQKELNLNQTGAVDKGKKVKTGKITGADCLLLGDITIFGRDDKAEGQHVGGSTYGSVLHRVPLVGNKVGSLGQFKKEEKAVVAIALRIVDTETGEVLETAEARGESSRSSKNWDVFVAGGGNSVNASDHMTSSNFAETIIGEATSDAVNKVLKFLDDRVPQLPLHTRTVEGMVARASGSSVILGIGSTEGVEKGDHFEVHKILNEIRDPTTKEVLDVETQKVGEMVITEVREKIATGAYSGQPIALSEHQKYTARLIQ
jgi:curli biogenesis system outer membrane secretion channel CsgG